MATNNQLYAYCFKQEKHVLNDASVIYKVKGNKLVYINSIWGILCTIFKSIIILLSIQQSQAGTKHSKKYIHIYIYIYSTWRMYTFCYIHNVDSNINGCFSFGVNTFFLNSQRSSEFGLFSFKSKASEKRG